MPYLYQSGAKNRKIAQKKTNEQLCRTFFYNRIKPGNSSLPVLIKGDTVLILEPCLDCSLNGPTDGGPAGGAG